MDYLERNAIVTAVEIQQEIDIYDRDLEFLSRQIVRLTAERRLRVKQMKTLKENYKECKL